MKLFKSTLLAFTALSAVAFASCDDAKEATYVPGEQSPGAYLPGNAPTSVNISEDDGTFAVTVYRTDKSGAQDVAISSTEESGLFTIPASVHFNDGEDAAALLISYDPTKLEYDVEYPITLSLAEASEYGKASYSFNAVMAAPWSEWEFVANGNYTYNGQLYSGVDPGLPCYHRTNLKDASQQQFRIDHLFTDVTCYLDYNANTGEIRMPITYIGEEHSSYGSMYAADYGTYARSQGADTGDNIYGLYEPETGLFKIDVIYFVSAGYFGNGLETFQLDGFPDCSAAVEYVGMLTDPNNKVFAMLTTQVGADAKGKLAAQLDADATALRDAIIAGTVEDLIEVEPGTQDVKIPVTKEGNYTVVLVTFDANGEAANAAATSFTIKLGGSIEDPLEGFELLGEAEFHDNIVAPMYGVPEDQAYLAVNVYENVETPGLFMVEKMYEAYGLPEATNIIINATVPTFVMIEPQYIGLDDQKDGPTFISSQTYVATGGDASLEDKYVAAGYPVITYRDGVIYFDPNATLFNWPDSDDKWYSSRNSWNGYLALPGAEVPEEAVKATPKAKTFGDMSFSYKISSPANVKSLAQPKLKTFTGEVKATSFIR